MDPWAIAALGFAATAVAASGTLAVFAIRVGGLKSDMKQADIDRKSANDQTEETAREYAQFRSATEAQLSALRADIAELEDDLERCATPAARRSRLSRLLQKAASRSRGSSSEIVPRDGSAVAAADESVNGME